MADLPYELFVGLRYTRARRGSGRNGFVSFISAVSMLGIALGVAALIVVLSVMNGFQEELRTRILAVGVAHRNPRARRLDGRLAGRDAGRADESARARDRALRARAGHALRGRGQSRRARARHRSDARGQGRRYRQSHARRIARRSQAGRLRHRARRRAGARAGGARRRQRRGDHPAGHGDAGRHAAAGEELPRRRRVRDRHVRVRQRACAHQPVRRAEALPPRRHGERGTAQARRLVRRAAGRAAISCRCCRSMSKREIGRSPTPISFARWRSRNA